MVYRLDAAEIFEALVKERAVIQGYIPKLTTKKVMTILKCEWHCTKKLLIHSTFNVGYSFQCAFMEPVDFLCFKMSLIKVCLSL